MAVTTPSSLIFTSIQYNGSTVSSPPSTCPTDTSTVSLVANGSGTITLNFSLIITTEYDNTIYSSLEGLLHVYWEHCNSAVSVYATNFSWSANVTLEDYNGYQYTADPSTYSISWTTDSTTASTTFARLGYFSIQASDLMNSIQFDFTLTFTVDGTLFDVSDNPQKDGILFYMTSSGQVHP